MSTNPDWFTEVQHEAQAQLEDSLDIRGDTDALQKQLTTLQATNFYAGVCVGGAIGILAAVACFMVMQ